MVCKKEGKQNFQIILLLMVEQGIIRGCCLHKWKLGFNHSHFVFNTYVACMLFFFYLWYCFISVFGFESLLKFLFLCMPWLWWNASVNCCLRMSKNVVNRAVIACIVLIIMNDFWNVKGFSKHVFSEELIAVVWIYSRIKHRKVKKSIKITQQNQWFEYTVYSFFCISKL